MGSKRLLIILSIAWIFFAAELERGFYSDVQSQLSKITNSAANLSPDHTFPIIAESAFDYYVLSTLCGRQHVYIIQTYGVDYGESTPPVTSEIKLANFLKTLLIASPAYSQEKQTSDYPGFRPGYTVQVVSVSDESSAVQIEKYFQDILNTDAIIRYENRLWKVCAGKFDDRESAEKFCGKIKLDGYPEAFVVERPIPTVIQGFRVQLSTQSTKSSAEAFADKISPTIGAEVHVIEEGNFWKVRAGDFAERQKAEVFCDILVKQGFNDAWIVPDSIETDY